MRRLSLIILPTALLVLLVACTSKQTGQMVDALSKVPFVDRTEKEINDWFDNTTIIDDKPMTSGTAINGEPTILLINKGPGLTVKGISYSGVLCITQRNTLPGGQQAKYAARLGIKVLNNPNLFECGEIELVSCDGDPMAANVTFLDSRPLVVLEQKFRDSANNWLKNDIVKTLKSTTNKNGFADPANAQPRNPAKVRGHFYSVTEDKGPPPTRSIGFFAE
ncbi:MAG: hypothetical protein JSU85_13285 [Candidatus Zixiibacteriota bacterium]|nr:MAG: hypothetical protein JSU85_13285 [candidate division Zixibacteria bacterium]